MRVCVVGLGKVGLPLAVYIARRGRPVIGCDANPEVVNMVNGGQCPLSREEGLEDGLREVVAAGQLEASTDTAEGVRGCQAILVIVPALLTPENQADLSAIQGAAGDVARGLRKGSLVVFETTLPVGATRNCLGPILEDGSGLRAGRDFYLAFSPERVSSGRVLQDLATYPKIVGGIDAASTEAAAQFYRQALGAEVIAVSSAETAEFAKLAELTYRDVNIALANELALCGRRAGLDVTEAIAAANTQPYSHIHQPGVGVGGHCLPVNPWFLISGLGPAPLARLARQVNDGMAQEASRLLGEELGGLSGRRVLILGLAYRANVKEAYHSPALLLNEALSKAGARVLVHDPLFSPAEMEAWGVKAASLEPPPRVDAIVLQAYHDEYRSLDLGAFQGCRVVLDGRNALSREAVEGNGMRYLGIGR